MDNVLFKDYYSILDIKPASSQGAIKEAYILKAKIYHPDRNKSQSANEKMKEINEAYEILKDHSLRKLYDNEYYFYKTEKNNEPKSNEKPIVNDILKEGIHAARTKYDVMYGKAKTEFVNITVEAATEAFDAFKAGLWLLGIFGGIALIIMAFSK